MTKISRFTERCVVIAQRVTGDGDESAAPDGGGGFADYALVSLHCLRIYLDSSYRMTIDLLKEMPQITGEIGLNVADLPAPSTLCKALERIEMSLCRVLLRQSAFTNRRFVRTQNRVAILGRSCTIRPNTPLSTPRSTNATAPVATTATAPTTACRP